MPMEFKYDRASFAAVSFKTVRCLPVWFNCPMPRNGERLPAPPGVVYQVQANQFVDQGTPQVWYQPPYYGCADPLYPELSLEDGFTELLKNIHPHNLDHPYVLYGLVSNTGLVHRGPVCIVEARDPAPLVLLDAMCGGRLRMGGAACRCQEEFLTDKLHALMSNLEFWKDEIYTDEQIYGRPRRRYNH